MNTPCRGSLSVRIAAGAAVLFGAMTLLSGGQVLFGGGAAQAAAGNFVPFVLWFNFLSGFAYILAGIGMVLDRSWAPWLAIALASAIAAVFALFGLHVLGGGAFEFRTVAAMTLRLAVWVAIAMIARRSIR
ncbi:hypothetical protein [Paracoccus marinaquae]|uniref:DUF4345 domain-containing protein n=1 Tax=Paracoccus marinaquae TaxID=2841926 RepID=A0ABS6AL06_9RHOB|nr:hypothetical protein [Paracoccus marinaquae]MBU3030339.1 hypothetical protein [Paracoccus marinaquae]